MRAAIALAVLLTGCVRLPPPNRPLEALTPEENFKLGSAYEAQGESVAAAGRYRAAVKQDKKFTAAWIALGNLAFANAEFAQAEDDFRAALKASPEDAGASNNLAMTYVTRSTKLKEAEDLLREALDHGGPLKPYVLDTLANLYLKEKRYDEARLAVDEGIKSAKDGDRRLNERLYMTRSSVEAAVSRR